ncbi:MAG TPA: rod shape-determining protein RodA [bacterium]|nr:rod shape-determining protein RodA [bacterium]
MSKRLLRYLDWPLLGAMLALMAGGVLVLYSAVHNTPNPSELVRARVLHIIMALIVLGLLAAVDYQAIARLWRQILAGTVLSLLAVLVIGRVSFGAQRWIGLGPLAAFQPAELAKLALIVTLAKHIDGYKEFDSYKALVPVLAHAALPLVLIARQPDLGTALVVATILAAMIFVAQLPMRMLAALGAGVATVAPLAWRLLHDYQRHRLLVFLDPNADPLGGGYALIQSKIAVGSGQFFGKGLLHGTQSLLHFIPEQHTDFIFTVVGEEFGFFGACVLLGLFALWLWRAMTIAAQAKDRLGTLMAVGAVAMVAFHLVVNVGMTVGLMPITGIPLPWVSHGGSALITMAGATGLVLSIGMRRKKILF